MLSKFNANTSGNFAGKLPLSPNSSHTSHRDDDDFESGLSSLVLHHVFLCAPFTPRRFEHSSSLPPQLIFEFGDLCNSQSGFDAKGKYPAHTESVGAVWSQLDDLRYCLLLLLRFFAHF